MSERQGASLQQLENDSIATCVPYNIQGVTYAYNKKLESDRIAVAVGVPLTNSWKIMALSQA